METSDEFVTLLRSADATYVDAVTAVLDAEDIPYQHPGKNHAALLGAFSYIEIQLRVPRSRLSDARALLGELTGSLSPRKVAFRVRRSRAMGGILIGVVVGLVVIITRAALGTRSTRQAVLVQLAFGACAGYLIGGRRNRDHCSVPDCGKFLPASATRCDKCGARLYGVVQRNADHFAAAEAIEALDRESDPGGGAR